MYPVHERRYKIVNATPQILLNLMKHGIHNPLKVANYSQVLPEDTTFVYCKQDNLTNWIQMVCWSSEWPIVCEGCIPETVNDIVLEEVRTYAQLIGILAQHVGNSEGPVEVLERIIKERDANVRPTSN